MWQREQKLSSSEPAPWVVKDEAPRSNFDVQFAFANGLIRDRSVPSGGAGTPHVPSVAVNRESRKNAARHAGSRHEFDIIEPFHSAKILW
jgi:hypothetical protein